MPCSSKVRVTRAIALLLSLLLLASVQFGLDSGDAQADSPNAPNQQTSSYTSPGSHTYTVPGGVYRISITVIGAAGGGGGGGSGGQGGGDNTDLAGGAGGAAGTPGATVGTAGSYFHSASGGGGGGGGDSSVTGAGSAITAQGGNGGQGGRSGPSCASCSNYSQGGAGGVGGNSGGTGGAGGSGGSSSVSGTAGLAGASGAAGQAISVTRNVTPGTTLQIVVGSGGGGGGGGQRNSFSQGSSGSGGSNGRVTISNATSQLAPSVPQSVSASPTANVATSIDVMWSAPANDNGFSVTHYDIRYRVTGTGSWTPLDNIGGTSRTITNLQPHTSYDVQVRAANIRGDGSWSGTATSSTTSSGTVVPPFGSITAAATVSGAWKCVATSTAQTFFTNNVSFRAHGICARPSGVNGVEVELHMPATAKFSDLKAFGDVTGLWWLIESGETDEASNRIYDDASVNATVPNVPLGAMAFTEQSVNLASSTRLGYGTKAISVTDDNCAEGSGREGFGCARVKLTALVAGDMATLNFGLEPKHNISFADTPVAPQSLSITRSDDYTSATITWTIYDAVSAYQLQRLTAVQVDVADVTRIEYGDPVTFDIAGTQSGVRQEPQTSLEANRTYQYRLRGRGAAADSWGPWSEFVFSGAKPQVDLAAPNNLVLVRDADSVLASWTPPPGTYHNFTLQRQELLEFRGSSFFGNIVTLPTSGGWLPGNSNAFDDTSILPTQTYEYRVAAVFDNQVGVYTDWFRVGPPVITLGPAPANLRLIDARAGARVFDDRRQFWLGWDAAPGAVEYEVHVVSLAFGGGHSSVSRVVSDTLYFHTAYRSVWMRVRGRTAPDATRCGAASDNRCVTEWSDNFRVSYSPLPEPPPAPPPSPRETSAEDTRRVVIKVIEDLLDDAGTEVDGALVLQLLTLLFALALGGASIAIAWRRGMTPLGFGMGCAIVVMVLYAGYKLWGIPVAWPIGVQAIIAIGGAIAGVRQFGVLRA